MEQAPSGGYLSIVSGQGDEYYPVEQDVAHPRSSKCNCPHAEGRPIVCKHAVATCFTLFPDEAKRLSAQSVSDEQAEEKRAEEIAERLQRYVSKMKKDELQEALLTLLYNGPEWQYNKFIHANGLNDV